MTTIELWAHLVERGQLQMRPWYLVALWPTLALALIACGLAWQRARAERLLQFAAAWFGAAGLVLVSLWPGWHVELATLDFLQRAGFQPPDRPQLLSRSTLQALARLLDAVAYLQAIGLALAALLVVVALIRRSPTVTPRPVAERLPQTAYEPTFDLGGPVREDASATRLMLVVQSGLRQGARATIGRGLILGRHLDPLRLSDPIISSRHASIIVAQGLPQICDEGSRNGTYLERSHSTIHVSNALTPLYAGDRISLGHPSHGEAIHLRVVAFADEDLE